MLTLILSTLMLGPLLLASEFWFLLTLSLCCVSLFSLLELYSSSHLYVMVSTYMGGDMLSQLLICLTFFIFVLMFLASQDVLRCKNSVIYFVASLLVLLLCLLLCFSSSISFLFYFFFEASLIPTVILILGWGYQPERLGAGNYMMLYTVAGSLPLLLGLVGVYTMTGTSVMMLTHIKRLPVEVLGSMSWGPCLVFFVAFLVKLPMFSLHLWLPKAHVEAPVAGSMVLAAVLLKLGGYGLLRVYQYVNFAGSSVQSFLVVVGMWGGFLTSLVCLRQVDVKSLIAYSSVGHMSLVLVGILSETMWGWSGALCLMMAHGFCSSGLFTLANYGYQKVGTRSLFLMKGFLLCLPAYSLWFFLFCVMNMAAPPSLNLLGEIFIYVTCAFWSYFLLVPLGLMSFFAAAYSLYLYTCTQHGSLQVLLHPMSGFASLPNLVLFLHWIPVNMLILKSTLVYSWL